MERTALTNEELRRIEILSRVAAGGLSVKSAAEMMGVSYRQAKRLRQRFSISGGPGLKHGNAGKRSNRAKPAALRRKVLRLIRKSIPAPKRNGRADTGSRTSGQRRWGGSRCRDITAMDAGGRVMDAATQESGASEAEGTPRAFLGAGADGRKFPPLAGESRSEGLPDEPGGRCDQPTMSHLGRRKRSGRRRNIAAVDRAVRCAIGPVHGLEKCLCAEPTEKELYAGDAPVTQFGAMCQRLGIRIIAW